MRIWPRDDVLNNNGAAPAAAVTPGGGGLSVPDMLSPGSRIRGYFDGGL
jgi:hypothetical protein